MTIIIFAMVSSLPIMAAAAFIALAALLYQPVTLRMEVLGVNRPLDAIKNIHGKELRAIPDTLIMEDLHYHRPSNLLFGASEEHEQAHVKWDPSMSVFEDPSPVGRGSIVVIEPEVGRLGSPALNGALTT